MVSPTDCFPRVFKSSWDPLICWSIFWKYCIRVYFTLCGVVVCMYLKVTQLSYVQLCDAMDYSLPGSSVHGLLQVRILVWVAIPFSRGSFQPRSPALLADSLPVEPQGKPKRTGMASLFLLQGSSWPYFLLQEFNRGLLHCRWILYQLSCQGSPACWQRAPYSQSGSYWPGCVASLCWRF